MSVPKDFFEALQNINNVKNFLFCMCTVCFCVLRFLFSIPDFSMTNDLSGEKKGKKGEKGKKRKRRGQKGKKRKKLSIVNTRRRGKMGLLLETGRMPRTSITRLPRSGNNRRGKWISTSRLLSLPASCLAAERARSLLSGGTRKRLS